MPDTKHMPIGDWTEKRSNHDLPNVRQMELFVHVVQTGSFSAAGRRVGMSPASVSRYINGVEDQLGTRLFNRTSRKLSLSDAGEIFYHHANAILQQMRDLQQEIAARQDEPAGLLRVRAMMMVGVTFIAEAVAEFHQAYPEITVDLTLSNESVDIVEENIDVDIRVGYLADSSMIARKLLGSRRELCATPDYLEKFPAITGPEDLRGLNCLAYRTNRGPVTWKFRDPAGELSEVPVSGSLVTNSGDILLTLVRSGAGVGLLPDWSIEKDVAAGRLVRVLENYSVSFAEFENDIYAVYSSGRYLPARTRVFLDFLAGFFRRG